MLIGKRPRVNSLGTFYSYLPPLRAELTRPPPSSRSVFERAMDVDPSNMKLWLSYTEMVRLSPPPSPAAR